jgi:hypothetical protein
MVPNEQTQGGPTGHDSNAVSGDSRAGPALATAELGRMHPGRLVADRRDRHLLGMYVVTEADAAAIREVYETGGELSAAVELRRRFPGIIDNATARPSTPPEGEGRCRRRVAALRGTRLSILCTIRASTVGSVERCQPIFGVAGYISWNMTHCAIALAGIERSQAGSTDPQTIKALEELAATSRSTSRRRPTGASSPYSGRQTE